MCCKFCLKIGWFYARRISYRRASGNVKLSEGILHISTIFYFVYVYAKRLLKYHIHSKWFALREWQSVIPFKSAQSPERGHIYIYIYSHPQRDCFVVSQLISVARHAGHFKLGLKPAPHDIRLSIIPLSHQLIYVSSGIRRRHVVALWYEFWYLIQPK